MQSEQTWGDNPSGPMDAIVEKAQEMGQAVADTAQQFGQAAAQKAVEVKAAVVKRATAAKKAAVKRVNEMPAQANIGISVGVTGSGGLPVEVKASTARDAKLYIALVEGGVASQVSAGENKGGAGAKKAAKKAVKKARPAKKAKPAKKAPAKKAKPAKKSAKKATRKKGRRTTLYRSKGKKLYAVRDAKGHFKDIQTYKRAHTLDMKRKSKAEIAAKAKSK